MRTKAPKKTSPKRPYRALIENLAKVWAVQSVAPEDAILEFGGTGIVNELSDFVRLSVWNICKGVGNESFTRDFIHLLGDSDIFMLQEALLSSSAINSMHTDEFLAIHGASYRRSDGLRDGVLTMTRTKTSAPAQRILCKYPEPVLKTPKAALITEFRNPVGDIITFVNIHATLIRTPKALHAELDHLFSHLPNSGPMVLAGDFNTFTLAFTRTLIRFLNQQGLEMALMEADNRSQLASLDHVFVRDMKVQSAIVRTDIKSSDHFPLTLTLSTRK